MSAVADNLARQVGIIQAAIKAPFSAYPDENASIIAGLAAFLESKGTTDVRNLRWFTNEAANLEFFFDIATQHVYPDFNYGTVQSFSSNPYLSKTIYYQDGKFAQFFIHCAFTSDGFPVFYANQIKHGNPWVDAFQGIAMIAGVAIAFAFPVLATTIGQAIMGAELAAAYPAVATGLGQVCVNTALNGGDVQSAVVGAMSGGVGGGVGGLVASATDSAIIGAAAGAVTKTAIVGGNIEQAAIQSLVSSGIQSVAQLPTFSGAQDMKLGDTTGDGGLDTYWMPADVAPILDVPVYTDTPDLGSDYGGFDYETQGYHDPVWSVNGGPEGATVLAPGATTPPAGPSGVVTSVNGSNLTQLALTAIKAVSSWNQAGQPAIRTSNATVRANPDGTLTQASGATTRMPTGTPYLTANNSLVTNNGDGTFTTVSANGAITTQLYAASSSSAFGKSISIGGLQVSPVVLAAAAVGAVLLLRR